MRVLAPTVDTARRPPAAPARRRDLAQGLGDWLGAFDAVALHGAHQKVSALLEREAANKAPAALTDAHASAQATVAQLRQTLTERVRTLPQAPLPWGDPPPPRQELSAAPFVRRHLELQRQTEQQIDAVHNTLRQQLSRLSPRLHALAVLDVAMGQSLAVHEPRLLAQTTTWLERRFVFHRDAHARRPEPEALLDDPAHWRAADGWLSAFEQDWQALALAELDHRLLPTQGLLSAVATSHTP